VDDAIPIDDFCRMLGGEYLGATDRTLREERTMTDHIEMRIKRVESLRAQHLQQAEASKMAAHACLGAIQELQLMKAAEAEASKAEATEETPEDTDG